MRITALRTITVNLQGNIANAVVDFSSHTVSLVAVICDQVRNGKPVTGIAFNSIGRFAQGGILEERLFPRILQAAPDELLNAEENAFDPAAIARIAMRNEKPGGHGDRAGAVAALELAIWDLNAKLADLPACALIAQSLRKTPAATGVPVYAAGGYYYPSGSVDDLRNELARYRDDGYPAYKIKIGGTSLASDLQRVETAIDVAGNANAVAVDANGRFDLAAAKAYGSALAQYALKWYEEPGDPLDYALMNELADCYPGPLATGENLFSKADVKNLLAYGGLRPSHDVLQMDPGLAYGLTEYIEILNQVESNGFSVSNCIPHGGHLINLHIAAALGLGGCEAYPGVFQPFGGYSPQCKLAEGRIYPSDAPGFGLEQKPELAPFIEQLLEH